MSGCATPSRAARTEKPRGPVTARLYPTGLSTSCSDVTAKEESMTTPHRIPQPLIRSIADYIDEEIKRNKKITDDTIADAVDAFVGGARYTQISGSCDAPWH